MLRQRHRAEFAFTVGTVFAVLLRVLGRSRWAAAECLDAPGQLPPPGRVYATRRSSVTTRGRVVECLPPVALTLYETVIRPPGRVHLRLRWRLEPSDPGCLVLLEAGYRLGGVAHLNRRHWRSRIDSHCMKLLLALGAALEAGKGQDAGISGQKTGRSSMTVRNTITVKGRPSFR